MENSPHNTYESESTRELLPTKNMEVAVLDIPNRPSSEIPAGTYAHREGFIAISSENGSVRMMPDVGPAAEMLLSNGYVDSGDRYNIPFTGIESDGRSSQEFKDVESSMAYNLAGMDAGLKEIDYASLDYSSRQSLEQIGFQGTNVTNGALIQEGSFSFRVSSGREAPDIIQRAGEVGTFSHVPIVYGQNGEAVPGIALTDQAGNQTIAPRNEAIDNLLESTGYRQVDQPTFNADVMSHLQSSYNNQTGDYDQGMKSKFESFMRGSPMSMAASRILNRDPRN